MPGESWRYGDMTTMPSGRIRHSETRRHCKRAERLSNLRAPRPARLPKPKPMIIKIKPADSRYERGTDGGQVTGPELRGDVAGLARSKHADEPSGPGRPVARRRANPALRSRVAPTWRLSGRRGATYSGIIQAN